MISVASTLLLATLVFSSVSTTLAAPVGTRTFDVRSMRRMEAVHMPASRREHHSARSVIVDTPKNDTIVPVEPAPPAQHRRHHAKRSVPRHVSDAIPRRARGVVADSVVKPRDVPVKKSAVPTDVAKSFIPDTSTENVPREADPAKPVVQREEAVGTGDTTSSRIHREGKPMPIAVPRAPEVKDDTLPTVTPHTPEVKERAKAVPRAPDAKDKVLRSRHQQGNQEGAVPGSEKKHDTRGPIRAIAMFKRRLDKLD